MEQTGQEEPAASCDEQQVTCISPEHEQGLTPDQQLLLPPAPPAYEPPACSPTYPPYYYDGTSLCCYPSYGNEGQYDANAYDCNYQASPFVYTAEAVYTSHCSQCNRTFMNPHAVLQHMRDHAAHRDSLEAQEAAYVLEYHLDLVLPEGSEQAADHLNSSWDAAAASSGDYSYWDMQAYQMQQGGGPAWYGEGGVGDYNAAVLGASSAYTPSDAGYSSNCAGDEAAPGAGAGSADAQPAYSPAGKAQQHAPYGNGPKPRGSPAAATNSNNNRSNRSTNRPRNSHVQAQRSPPPPKPDDESAFPPLSPAGPTSAPPPTRRWVVIPRSTRKLRAEANEYKPAGTTVVSSRAASPAPTDASLSTALTESVADSASPAPSVSSGHSTPVPAAAEAVQKAAEDVPVSPTTVQSSKQKTLRVDAPAWAPSAPVAVEAH